MTLDEQLAMATSTVAVGEAVQPAPAVAAPVNPAQVQAGAQVVQPTQTVMSTPVQATITTTAVPTQGYVQTPAAAPSIDLNQAAAEAEQHYGVQEISLGQKISTRAIDPVKKMEKGEKMRFTIIDGYFASAKIHVHEDLGKIACFTTPTSMGQCCKDLDEPKVRYYMPVLVYSTMPGDPRTPLPQGKSELRLLVIWDGSGWDKICEDIIEAGGNKEIDFIATSEDSYGRLDFKGQQTSFRAMPEYAQAIADATAKWRAVKDKAALTVRRDMDAERYAKLTIKASVPQLQSYSPEDIMG